MKHYLKTLTVFAISFLSMLALCRAAEEGQEGPPQPYGFSIETLGAIRYQDMNLKKEAYGAGLDLGYSFNTYVKGHVRAIAYESPDSWRGGVVDEGSVLVEARLLSSSNQRVSLAAIGGADRDFRASDWGFSVGLRPSLKLIGGLSAVGEARIRAWIKQEKDLLVTAGLNYSF